MTTKSRDNQIVAFWFRRDLRLQDNTALEEALASGFPVLPLFIFDTRITAGLPKDDARISFIYNLLEKLHRELGKRNTSLLCLKGDPVNVWRDILADYNVSAVYANRDYEPYAVQRDESVAEMLGAAGIAFHNFKDQVIFDRGEVMKSDGKPYTVYTPYKKKWLERYRTQSPGTLKTAPLERFLGLKKDFPGLVDLGFRPSTVRVKDPDFSVLDAFAARRDFPAADAGTYLGPHLRFGTLSIRQVLEQLQSGHETFLGELVWREFFMQILHHFPHVVDKNFNRKYDGVPWRNDEGEFQRWCEGRTGYPLVDAGMRQLNETGYLHNRVRMVTASFLCKHLLIDWRWGEAWFAEKLLDYEPSSNNGNWQWAAGTGCDAAPYFRIFNPSEQVKRFDRDFKYIRQWLPEFNTPEYPDPIVEHRFARERVLEAYKRGTSQSVREF